MNKDNTKNFNNEKTKFVNTVVQNEKKMLCENASEIIKIDRHLATRDFSKNIDKASLYDKCNKKINGEGEIIVKKSKIVYRIAAACVVFAVAGTVLIKTPFADDLFTITKSINLGNISSQEIKENADADKVKTMPVPDCLKGKLFDKDGKEITEFEAGKNKVLYTASGEKIYNYDAQSGKITTEKEWEQSYGTITDIDDIGKYSDFKVTVPSYLPDDYKFDHATVYKGDDGKISGKYIDLHFKNSKTGDDIYIQERLNCKETAFADGGESVEEIKINGLDATFTDGHTIDFQTDKVLYSVIAHMLTADQLKKVAESIPVN